MNLNENITDPIENEIMMCPKNPDLLSILIFQQKILLLNDELTAEPMILTWI